VSHEINVDGQKLTIKRVFKAPVEKVYQAWTDPDKMVRWFASNERWRTPEVEVGSSPGGKYNLTMRHSDGDKFQSVGQIVEIIENQRISFTWTMPDAGLSFGESLVTVDLREVPEGTELTLTHDRLTNADLLKDTSGGWAGCLTMLEGYLVNGVELSPP
jgi:uncharacterized protein YndB with AHSA1/START domain